MMMMMRAACALSKCLLDLLPRRYRSRKDDDARAASFRWPMIIFARPMYRFLRA